MYDMLKAKVDCFARKLNFRKKTLKMTQNYGKLLGGGRQSVDTRSTFGEPLKLKWANYESANWLLSDFWAREPRLNRKISNFDFWVFLVISFAWNKSLCHRYQIYMNLCEWHLLFVICKHYLAICHKWILFLEWGQVFSGHNQSAIWLNCYCWGNSSIPEGRFSKWF